jgi:hypothetical protein
MKKRPKEKYYRCKVCGAVGNWKEFIERGRCHLLGQKLAKIPGKRRMK